MVNQFKYPNIDIKYGHFLAPFFNFYVKNNDRKDEPGWQPPTVEEIKKRITVQQDTWNLVADKIVGAMQDATGLTFCENHISVYIIPSRKGAFSDPIVISSGLEADRFVDVLTHELIHRLLTYNIENAHVTEALNQMYPNITDKIVLNHILVHAIHKHIYLDVLRDENRLTRDIESCAISSEYSQSWDIVEQDGYVRILKMIQGLWIQ